jgi:hypothetical protein
MPLWHHPGMAAVLGNPKLAVSASKLLRQGEKVKGAVPATETKASTRVLSRIPFLRIVLLPLSIYRLFKTPLRAIVWTDQRLVIMTRANLLNLTGRKVRKIVSEVAKNQRLEGGQTSSGAYEVRSLGRPLYVRERYVGDLLRLENERSKSQ